MVEWKKLIDVAVIKNGRDYKKLSHGWGLFFLSLILPVRSLLFF